MRTGETEARSPKYAHVERERRFLVDPSLCPDLSGVHAVLIEDRYVVGTRLRLRRMKDVATGETSLKLTKKYPSADPFARPIVTSYLDEREYALLSALPAQSLVKRRHAVAWPEGLSIDVFEGSLTGLHLAEIEFTDDATLQSFTPPAWIIREVSAEPCFDGGSLAQLDSNAATALVATATR